MASSSMSRLQAVVTRPSIHAVLRAASVVLMLVGVLTGTALVSTNRYMRENTEDRLTDQRAFDTLVDMRNELDQHHRLVRSELQQGERLPTEATRALERRVFDELGVVNDSLEPGEGDWHQQEIRRSLEGYFSASDRSYEARDVLDDDDLRREHDQALYAINNLMALLRTQATLGQTRFARLELLTEVGGLALAMSLVGFAGLLILWFAVGVKRPLDDLQGAVDRFDSRAPLRVDTPAPPELMHLGHALEELSARLVRQRANQLAFLASVAHDLRTPLTSLKLATARLTRHPGRTAPEQIEETAALVQRQAARMERMIGDLLDATRIEAGQLELRKERRDLAGLLREAVATFEERTAGYPVEMQLPEHPVETWVDPLRLEQVLHNLFSNAIKYSPMGGPIRIRVQEEAAFVRIEIQDFGVGIAPEQIEAVFEPFRRTGSLKDVVPGVGLGLSVCRRIVEAHGGTIWVESRLGIGSTFVIRLPVAGSLLAPVEPADVSLDGQPRAR